MSTKYLSIIIFLFFFFIYGCSKKSHPSQVLSTNTADLPAIKSEDTSSIKKNAFKPTRKDIIPNSIVVNDSVARKSIDGRLYYDLLKHRYWKNYKDGRYYLFNKSMYSDEAFKKP